MLLDGRMRSVSVKCEEVPGRYEMHVLPGRLKAEWVWALRRYRPGRQDVFVLGSPR